MDNPARKEPIDNLKQMLSEADALGKEAENEQGKEEIGQQEAAADQSSIKNPSYESEAMKKLQGILDNYKKNKPLEAS